MNTSLITAIQNPLIVSSGLLGYWSLNDGAGMEPYDYSGNNYTGSIKGSTVAWTRGKIGAGANFSGTGYINVARPSVLNTPSLTVCLWYKPDVVSAAVKSLIGSANAVNNGWGLNVDQQSNGSAAAGYVAFWLYNGSWRNVSSTGVCISVGTWTHIAVTYTNGGNAILYVNGAQYNSTGPWSAISYAASSFLTIGRDLQYGNETQGTIDDIRLYNRALAVDEIYKLFR